MNTLTTCSVVSFSIWGRGGGGINLFASEQSSFDPGDGGHVIVLFCGSCLLELLPFGWFVDVGLIGPLPFDDAGYDWLCELSPSATLVSVIKMDNQKALSYYIPTVKSAEV